MIEFRALGSLDLWGHDGEQVLSVLAQPKRTALLTYLAVESPRCFHRRDELIGIFWPDMEQARARAALRKSVHFLRRSLGERAIMSRGDEDIGLDWKQVTCDVTEFEDALAADHHETALELYRGDFLSGFHLSGCPEFDSWSESTRNRLRLEATRAAWAEAHRCIRGGGISDGERFGRKALDLGSTDEQEARLVIEALAASGDGVAAVRFFEHFAEVLKQRLDLEPSSETRALAEEIREGRGGGEPDRTAPIESEREDASGPPIPSVAAEQKVPGQMKLPGSGLASDRVDMRHNRYLALAVLAIGAIGSLIIFSDAFRTFLGGLVLPATTRVESSGLDPAVVAVEPFENLTGDPDLDELGRIASMVLTQAIERTRLVQVKTFDMAWSANDYIRAQAEEGRLPNRLAAFAYEVGAGTIIHGAYSMEEGELRFDTSITDAASGNLVRSLEPVSGDLRSPGAIIEVLQPRIMGALALEFDQALIPYVEEVVRPPTYEAALEFSRGARTYLGTGQWSDINAARDRLLHAHELDPTFFTPLVLAGWAQMNRDNDDRGVALRDSIWGVLFEHESELTPYEQAVVEGWRAYQQRDRNGYAERLEEACAIAPGSKACFHLALGMIHLLNKPKRALQVLNARVDPTRGWMRGWEHHWILLAEAYLLSGDLSSAMQAAENGLQYFPREDQILERLWSAKAALGLVDEGMARIREIVGPPMFGAGWREVNLVGFGNALWVHGFDAEAREVWRQVLDSLEAGVVEDLSERDLREFFGELSYQLGDLDRAEEEWRALAESESDSWEWLARLGMVAARRGDYAEARRVMGSLNTFEGINPYSSDLWKASILDAMGEKGEAVRHLTRLYQGPWLNEFFLYRRSRFFVSLRGYPPYEELFWPAGHGAR